MAPPSVCSVNTARSSFKWWALFPSKRPSGSYGRLWMDSPPTSTLVFFLGLLMVGMSVWLGASKKCIGERATSQDNVSLLKIFLEVFLSWSWVAAPLLERTDFFTHTWIIGASAPRLGSFALLTWNTRRVPASGLPRRITCKYTVRSGRHLARTVFQSETGNVDQHFSYNWLWRIASEHN